MKKSGIVEWQRVASPIYTFGYCHWLRYCCHVALDFAFVLLVLNRLVCIYHSFFARATLTSVQIYFILLQIYFIEIGLPF